MSGQTALDVMSAYVFPQTDIGARLDPNTQPDPVQPRPRARREPRQHPAQRRQRARDHVVASRASAKPTSRRWARPIPIITTQGVDLPGPLTTVVWATNQQTNAKIVLIGDSNFVSNGLVLSGGNGVLFTDSMAWLTGLGDKISFAPQAYGVGTPLIYVSTQTLDLITFLTIILLPGAVLASGVAIWMRRARR